MIRVLHILANLNRGGAETMIMNYYRHLDRSKVQFDFVVHTSSESAYDKEVIGMGGRIYRLPRFKGYNLISYQQMWAKLLKEHPEWRIVHVHFFTIAGVILPVAKRMRIPTRIVHSHNIASSNFSVLEKMGNFILRRVALKYATDQLACSNDAGKYYFGNRRFIIVKNAIDTERFIFNSQIRDEIRNRLGIDKKNVIGHVGRFCEQKNHIFLIDVFNEIYKYNNDSVLLLVGDGPLQNQMKETVKRLGLSDVVIFAGARDDIPQLMMAMDVFVFPSLYEGLGIVAIEAQAAGLYTILSDRVPDAAMITTLARKISLQENANCWANRILLYTDYVHEDISGEICKAGYEIRNNVQWLENYYLSK